VLGAACIVDRNFEIYWRIDHCLDRCHHILDRVMLGRELLYLCRRQLQTRHPLSVVAEDSLTDACDELLTEAFLSISFSWK